jgi:prolyl-tRNA synthetase
MRQTKLFTKTRFEAPADEVSKNAELLIRSGFIHKEMAGVYSYLPLGLRVINKLKKIVAEEMEKLGSTEILMSSLQAKEIWETTQRWDDEAVDVWFKTKLKSGTEIGLGWSHEEPITEMMKSHIRSFTDVPRYVHQFQNKLRNEVRAKSGILRCREFIMKDMYSFSATEEDHMKFYNAATASYMTVFKRIGLGENTFVTSASGGVFTDKFSHEFQTICDAGEDIIYINKEKGIAVNEEVFNEKTCTSLRMKESDFEKTKAAEVGNIFTFGTKKCEELGLYFTDTDGVKKPLYLGSYGIGISRLMGVITEVFATEKGMLWPKEVSPFTIHLIDLSQGDEAVQSASESLYEQLEEAALFDDRDLRAGEKFADADLIGIPVRIISSKKNLEKGVFEVTERATGETTYLTHEQILETYGA